MNSTIFDPQLHPLVPDQVLEKTDDMGMLLEGIKSLLDHQNEIMSAYQSFTAATKKEDKRTTLLKLLKAEHKLKGTVSYLLMPALDNCCRDFHSTLKNYTVDTETYPILQDIEYRYQQLIHHINLVIDHFQSNPKVDLPQFLVLWDYHYQMQIKELPLFDFGLTKEWDVDQRQKFCNDFYHIRGHFYDLLWLLGNSAPNCEKEKSLILDNIKEELGGEKNIQHEQLFLRFAKANGVHHLEQEFITNAHQPNYIDTYNQKQLQWFAAEPWDGKMAGFAAYERLDNTDYGYLLSLGQSLGVTEENLEFFEEHNHANHFSRLENKLLIIWERDRKIVRKGFDFIRVHQSNMWQQFSQEMFGG